MGYFLHYTTGVTHHLCAYEARSGGQAVSLIASLSACDGVWGPAALPAQSVSCGFLRPSDPLLWKDTGFAPKGQLAMSGDSLGHHSLVCATGIQMVEDRDAASDPLVCRTAPTARMVWCKLSAGPKWRDRAMGKPSCAFPLNSPTEVAELIFLSRYSAS